MFVKVLEPMLFVCLSACQPACLNALNITKKWVLKMGDKKMLKIKRYPVSRGGNGHGR